MKTTGLYLLTVASITLSCHNTTSDQPNEQTSTDSVRQQTSTTVGSDKDSLGCIGSAGYVWSPVKDDCIRVFEQIKLSPVDGSGLDSTAVAFMLFSADRTKAEVYLPGQPKPVTLDRRGEEGDFSWKNDSLEIITWKGYVLKRNDKAIYHGDE